MSTQSQQEANRENAAHSTGPTSDEGKATSSQNRRTHGLTSTNSQFIVLPSEDQATFERLLSDLDHEHEPATATELILVENIAQSKWLRDRALRLQDTCFHPETGQISDAKMFNLYHRYATTHERVFHKSLTSLLKLRSERQKLQIGFESQKRLQELFPIKLSQEILKVDQLEITTGDFARKVLREYRLHLQAREMEKAKNAA